jgi:hypothetical protein
VLLDCGVSDNGYTKLCYIISATLWPCVIASLVIFFLYIFSKKYSGSVYVDVIFSVISLALAVYFIQGPYDFQRFGPLYMNPQPQSALSIKITSPNGGETLTKGQTYRIMWTSSGRIDDVSIGYTPDDVSNMNWIQDNNIANTGYFDWKVDTHRTTKTQLKIYIMGYNTSGESVESYSNGYFTVLPAQ